MRCVRPEEERLLCHAEPSEVYLEALLRGTEHDDYAGEPADVVLRMADLAGGTGVDLEGEIERKMAKNKARPRMHGKAF